MLHVGILLKMKSYPNLQNWNQIEVYIPGQHAYRKWNPLRILEKHLKNHVIINTEKDHVVSDDLKLYRLESNMLKNLPKMLPVSDSNNNFVS